jgi:hypothetical protein
MLSSSTKLSTLKNGRSQDHVMNPVNETLTVELVYEGEGWLGFASLRTAA